MNRFTATIAVSAASLALGACADSSSKVAGPVDLQPQANVSELADGPGSISRHVMLTRAGYAANNAASKTAGTGGGTGIYYHGGQVLQSGTNVAAIYWAGGTTPIYNGGPTPGTNGAGTADGSLIGLFLRSLGGSPYFGINSTYTDGSGAHILNVVNYTQYWANNTNAPSGSTSISDAQMVAMLQSGFDGGKLTYNASTLYAIFTSGQVNLGGGFGTQYCAYHTHGTVTVGGVSKTVLYAAMPYDYAYPTACSNNSTSPHNDPGADAEVNTLAHETEETTTDMMGNAWFDRRGYENADKCAWTWGTTSTASNGGLYNLTIGGKNWLVQRNWKNSGNGGCYMS